MEDSEFEDRCESPPIVFSHSIPYNERFEREFAERGCDEDLEVTEAFEKTRKRRSSRKNWTRRKGEQKSRALSRSYNNAYFNGEFERNHYARSESSHKRSQSTASRPMSRRKQKILEMIGKPLKTRSVLQHEKQEAEKEANKFHCDYSSCSIVFENLENFVMHKIYDHFIPALYSCDQCNRKYTTQKELEIHNKIHDNDTFFCCYCRAACLGAKQLQEHLGQHFDFSVDCNFCYLSFLTRKELTQHIAQEHRRDKRVREMKKNLFLKISMKRHNENKTNNNIDKKKFKIKIILDTEQKRPESPDIFATLLQIKLSSANFFTNSRKSDSNSMQSVQNDDITPTSLSRDVTTDEDYEFYPNYKNKSQIRRKDDPKLDLLKPVVVLERMSEELEQVKERNS